MFTNKNFTEVGSSATGQKGPGQSNPGDGNVMQTNADTDNIKGIDTADVFTDQQAIYDYAEYSGNTTLSGLAGVKGDLSTFLSRQVYLKSVRWLSTMSTFAKLAYFNPVAEIGTNPYIKAKLQSFKAFKADVEVTFKINAQPFVSGALIISAMPAKFKTMDLFAPHLSFLPNVVINLPLKNDVTMRLPFVSENEAWNTGDLYEGWDIYVHILYPLVSKTSPDELTVVILGRYVNPELHIPCAQSGENEMAESAATGVVTRITGKIANFMEENNQLLHSLSSMAPPLTWMMRATNRVASYYGWCKPGSVENRLITTNFPAYRMGNCEGVDNGVVLGISPDNAVDSAHCGFGDIDEMNIAYLLERKHLMDTLVIGLGGRVFNTVLVPKTITSYIWKSFQFKRATFKLHFDLVKTIYHTGRLIVSLNYSGTGLAVGDMNSVFSKVVDIQEANSFVFTIPWGYLKPFDADPTYEVSMKWLTPLDAPDTVIRQIGVLMWVSIADFDGVKLAAQANFTNMEPIERDTLIPYKHTDMVRFCGGEKVTSLRSMAKRFELKGSYTIGATFDVSLEKSGTTFERINAMYAYRTGGVRWKIVFPVKYTLVVELAQMKVGPAQVFTGSTCNVAEVTVPYYQPVRRIRSFIRTGAIKLTFYNEKLEKVVADTTDHILVYLAGADDFSAFIPLFDDPDLIWH